MSLSALRLPLAALVIAAAMLVPIAAVLSSLGQIGAPGTLGAMGAAFARYGGTTLTLMALVALIATSIGVTAAWVVSAMEFPGRRLLSWLLVLPLAAPAYIVAYLYTDLLDYAGPVQTALRGAFDLGPRYWFPEIRSLPGAALMLGLVLYPYIYLLTRATFDRRGAAQWLAARSLGDTPFRAFWRVALPSARPAIAGGLALVMMETLADYGVADYFAVPTFSVGIFRTWLAMGDKALALQLSAMMLAVVFLLVALEAGSRRGETSEDPRGSGPARRMRLSRGGATLAWIGCGVPILLGFAVPMGALIAMTITNGDPQGLTELAGYAANTALVAISTAAIAVALAIVLAYAGRRGKRWTGGLIRLSTLGYALPGALLAVGLLSPLAGVDQALTRALRSAGFEVGLLLTGSIAVLVYALVIRFLTVGFNAVSSGLAQVSSSLEAAARSLGAGRRQVLATIHLPLIAPSVLAGLMLVVIDVLRELPATLILRPFNFDTLATRVYWLASDERLQEASTAALIIVALGLVPVLLLNRVGERR